MNPIIQRMSESLVSDEGPTAVEDTMATRPQPPTDKALTSTKPNRDSRKSSRRTVPKSRQPCKLKVGVKVLSALLVNESHGGFGGFAVLIDRLNGLKVGEKVEIHTDLSGFMVRIIHIQKVARPKTVAAKCNSWFLLGVKKMGSCFPL